MKLILALLMLSSVNAVTITQMQSSSEASSTQKFEVTQKSMVYEKRSNLFDLSQDFRLGEFVNKEKGPRLTYRKRLEEMKKKIRLADTVLKKNGGGFNDLSGNSPHDVFFALDGYRVSSDSAVFEELRSIFNDLLKENWKHQKGVRLDLESKKVIRVDKEKEEDRREFVYLHFCNNNSTPAICYFKDSGYLFLK